MAMEYFHVLKIRPHWKQFIVNEFGLMILATAGATSCIYIENPTVWQIVVVMSIITVCFLTYRAVYIASMKYIITGEQLIFQHGVFSCSTEYMELYRVVDYQQHKSFAQQVLGLKTIIIMSGDKTMPCLPIIGVVDKKNIVSEIRMRVEYNKKRRGIYEITNRY